MLFPGTEMHMVTFGLICVELVILLYLFIYKMARPQDGTISLDIFLLLCLLAYNITGGLLPDPALPGSYYLQESIAYFTGFITPCYFPYYVLKGFGLKSMSFHAYKGVFLFLLVPYLVFVTVLLISGNLSTAKNILILPVVYGVWVIITTAKAIFFKYGQQIVSTEAKEEILVLVLCLCPWVALPLIAYFDISQVTEVISTNTGFLLLLALHLKQNITQLRREQIRLIESESQLRTWNARLQEEVLMKAQELEKLNKEERFFKNCIRYRLTNREKEIALGVYSGNTYKQVAEDLFIAERTVAKHVQNIFEKISVSNRVELCHKLSA